MSRYMDGYVDGAWRQRIIQEQRATVHFQDGNYRPRKLSPIIATTPNAKSTRYGLLPTLGDQNPIVRESLNSHFN